MVGTKLVQSVLPQSRRRRSVGDRFRFHERHFDKLATALLADLVFFVLAIIYNQSLAGRANKRVTFQRWRTT